MKLSRLLLALAVVGATACAPEQGVVIKKKGNGFELRIDGEPTFIKGVGGTNRLDWLQLQVPMPAGHGAEILRA